MKCDWSRQMRSTYCVSSRTQFSTETPDTKPARTIAAPPEGTRVAARVRPHASTPPQTAANPVEVQVLSSASLWFDWLLAVQDGSALDAEQPPFARDALQLVEASVLELDPGAGDEIPDGAGNDHLALALRVRRDASPRAHGDSLRPCRPTYLRHHSCAQARTDVDTVGLAHKTVDHGAGAADRRVQARRRQRKSRRRRYRSRARGIASARAGTIE